MSLQTQTASRGEALADGAGRVVVVGFDGSPESCAAVAVAGERAGPAGEVVVVHVMDPAPNWLGTPYYERALAVARDHRTRVLQAISAADPGDTRLEPCFVEGDPAEALVRVAEARDAEEIVVGSRGRGRLRAVLGSVSHDLLGLADRPVVVVPLPEGPPTPAA